MARPEWLTSLPVHLVSGSQHIVQNVTLSGSTVTVTIPPQPKAAVRPLLFTKRASLTRSQAKGLTFVSIINNADTGTYSGCVCSSFDDRSGWNDSTDRATPTSGPLQVRLESFSLR